MSKQRSFTHNVAWNLIGAGVPLAFAFLAIPTLLSGYGNARFGFLTIVWSLIGYFSIFDFGIGRALTKLVSDRLGTSSTHDIPDVTATGLRVMMILGVFAAAMILVIAPWLVGLLKIDASLLDEAITSLRVLALSIPFVILSAGLIGILEAHGQFRSINVIRLAMGLLNFAAPLLMLHWSNHLVPATISLAISRVITTVLYFSRVRRLDSVGASHGRFKKHHIRELLGFGGWITLSNLISPLMAQMDKLVIGAVVALALLPFYSVPADLVNRFSFAPISMVGVFFPAFASTWSSGKREAIPEMYAGASKAMCAALFPAALCLYAFAPEGLTLWMGQNFSSQSTPLLRWLALGLLVNSIARVPHALLQATGRPSTTAKLHLMELPIYALGLWLLLSHYGILGAAIAWAGRMALDFLLLVLCANSIIPGLERRSVLVVGAVAGGVCIILGVGAVGAMLPRAIACVVISAASLFYALHTLSRIRRHD
ncbi:flippase [Dyella japonica]|uniref:flippase n=1 Tax=Dyella japonica TaxID=231455 RepID=UPI00069ADBBC|nr:flippase [Dyella japonica]